MFLGAIEVEKRNVYASENALQKMFDEDNIILIENDYVLPLLEGNVQFIQAAHFIRGTWQTIKKRSQKHIVQGLVFEANTPDCEIEELLKQRVKYFYSLHNVEVTVDKNDICIKN